MPKKTFQVFLLSLALLLTTTQSHARGFRSLLINYGPTLKHYFQQKFGLNITTTDIQPHAQQNKRIPSCLRKKNKNMTIKTRFWWLRYFFTNSSFDAQSNLAQ